MDIENKNKMICSSRFIVLFSPLIHVYSINLIGFDWIQTLKLVRLDCSIGISTTWL